VRQRLEKVGREASVLHSTFWCSSIIRALRPGNVLEIGPYIADPRSPRHLVRVIWHKEEIITIEAGRA